MKLMNVKGTYDFMPSDMKIRNEIIDVLRRNFEKYGYYDDAVGVVPAMSALCFDALVLDIVKM